MFNRGREGLALRWSKGRLKRNKPIPKRDRKVFLKSMTAGFEMYGQLIEKLGLKEQK